MSTEAEVAMLMLRLLIDRPKELQKVLDYLRDEVMLRKAILEVGNTEVATREEIMSQFEDKFGLTVEITDAEPDDGAKKNRMIELPDGVRYKVG